MLVGDRFTYIDPRDKDKDNGNASCFFLRPLTVEEIFDVDGALSEDHPKPGTRVSKLLRYGLLGWSNYISNGDEPAELYYDQEITFHPNLVNWIPVDVRARIAQKVYEISVLPDKAEDELINVVRTSHLKSKTQGDTWDCDTCIKEKYQLQRKCSLEGAPVVEPGKAYSEKYKAPWKQAPGKKRTRNAPSGSHGYKKCPVGLASKRAWGIYSIVKECEISNVMPCDPPVLFKQPYAFLQAKRVISHEEYAIEKSTAPNENLTPDKSPGMPGVDGDRALSMAQDRIRARALKGKK